MVAVAKTNGKLNGHHQPLVIRSDQPLPPHSAESEEALLGSILISVDALLDCDEIGLTEDDFFIHRHGMIFDAMKTLYGKCDMVSLCDELERRGQLEEIGGPPFLTSLVNAVPTAVHAFHYAQTVKRDAVARGLIEVAGEIARLGFHNREDGPADLLQTAGDLLQAVSNGYQSGHNKPAGYYCEQYLKQLDEYYQNQNEIIGLPTSLKDFDKLLGGLRRGHLILIGGRPGMGKSALVLQMACHTIKKQKSRVLYFSLEMIGEELIERIVSRETGLDSDMLHSRKLSSANYAAINRVMEMVSTWPLIIDDTTQHIEAIRAKVISQKFKTGLDLVIIDYGQRIQTGKNYPNRDTELGVISAALKRLANDLHIPVVCVVSLSRKCEERGDKRPMLSDLRESGNWEYDANQVVFVYRDEIYNSKTNAPNVAELIVAKNRGGKTGVVSTYFKKHVTTFVDLAVLRG